MSIRLQDHPSYRFHYQVGPDRVRIFAGDYVLALQSFLLYIFFVKILKGWQILDWRELKIWPKKMCTKLEAMMQSGMMESGEARVERWLRAIFVQRW